MWRLHQPAKTLSFMLLQRQTPNFLHRKTEYAHKYVKYLEVIRCLPEVTSGKTEPGENEQVIFIAMSVSCNGIISEVDNDKQNCFISCD